MPDPRSALYHLREIIGCAEELKALPSDSLRTRLMNAIERAQIAVKLIEVRHKKRGTTYEVIGEASLQCNPIFIMEGEPLTVYRGEDGQLWARPTRQFNDGRFENVD